METNNTRSFHKSIRLIPPFRFRIISILFFILAILIGFAKYAVAQTNAGRMEIPSNKVFQLDSDTLMIGELIIGDSSRLMLTKPAHFIKANRIIIGSGCQILGVGKAGANGKNGKSAATPTGLCKPGVAGEAGQPGLDGEPGKDLTIEATQLEVRSILSIDLIGGNGGDGGKGGKGSHGSNTTVHCSGNGGNGGKGGNGGNGGKGGTFSLLAKSPAKSELVSKFSLTNRGGYRGIGGDGGKGGSRGVGASESRSKIGLEGKAGIDGQYGKEGRMLFYSIFNSRADQPPQASASTSGK